MPAEVPASLTYTFYALVAWGLSAMFAAFRILAGDSLQRSIAMRVVILLWLGVPMILAVRGVLFDFSSSPPNLLRLVVPMMVAVVILCASPWGRYAAAKLPTTLLVGTQTFRLPLEIVLYGLAVLALVIALLPFALTNAYFYDVAILVGLNAIVCVGLNLLIGYAGQISLGHAGFFGLGAYGSALLVA